MVLCKSCTSPVTCKNNKRCMKKGTYKRKTVKKRRY